MKDTKCKKFEFKGKFEIDGFYGGDTYPFWLVSEETIVKIKGEKALEYTEKVKELYKLYVSDLWDYSDEGKKQTISIRILND